MDKKFKKFIYASHINDFMNPSEFPEVENYPTVKEFLKQRVDMIIEDMRSMLGAPHNKFTGGCNFALFNFMIDFISGISIILYNNCELEECIEEEIKPNEMRDHTKALLKKYYPWEEEELSGKKEDIVNVIWEVRNSLTHRLGLLYKAKIPRKSKAVRLDKTSLNYDQIKDLEKRLDKVKAFKEENDVLVIDLIQFYRGIHKMLQKLFKDKYRMGKAEEFIKNNKEYFLKEESEEDSTKGTITEVGTMTFTTSGSTLSLTFDKGMEKNRSF